ncbi:MAG: ABC transporter permease [Sphaerobacteraceae bacterium]|nr:MAG: ABC transporter permease [Sphaerobacteraceae bacterium]
MTSFLAMTVANFKMIVRNRTAMFFLLGFPVIFMVLFGFLFGEGETRLHIGIAGEDSSPIATAIAEQMEQTDGFMVYRNDGDHELSAIDDGDRLVVIVFSDGTGSAELDADIYVNQSNPTFSQIGLSAVEQFLLQAEMEITGQPRMIQPTVADVEGDSFGFIEFFLPGVIGIALMTNGVQALSSTFVAFREKGILRRIKGTPFPLWQFILSRITTQVVISVFQIVILIAIAIMLFDVQISSSYLAMAVLVVIGAFTFLSIGFIVSAFAGNTDVADAAGTLITLPMMFLSGVFFPTDDAPGWLQPIIGLLPLTYLVNGLRDVMIRGAGVDAVMLEILVLVGTAVAGFLISVYFFRWESRGA